MGSKPSPGAPALSCDPFEDGDIYFIEAGREALRRAMRPRAHDLRIRDRGGDDGYLGRVVHGSSHLVLHLSSPALAWAAMQIKSIAQASRDGFVLGSGR